MKMATAHNHDLPALSEPEGPHLVPTVFAVGPWSPHALHGGALAVPFAAALDRSDMTVARITMDLMATVRLGPWRLEVEELGGGRRVQGRAASLRNGERPVAHAPRSTFAEASTAHPGAPVDPERSQLVAAPPKTRAPPLESRAG